MDMMGQGSELKKRLAPEGSIDRIRRSPCVGVDAVAGFYKHTHAVGFALRRDIHLWGYFSRNHESRVLKVPQLRFLSTFSTVLFAVMTSFSHRRTFLRLGALSTLMPVLTACGFRLRGVQMLPFSSLYVSARMTAPLTQELMQQLALTQGLNVLTDVAARDAAGRAPHQQAQVILHLEEERYERVVLARTVSGQVRELELRLSARFHLSGSDGRVWLPATRIQQKRNVSYSETLALAKDEEEDTLRRDMRGDIARQIVRRLSMLTPPVQSPL